MAKSSGPDSSLFRHVPLWDTSRLALPALLAVFALLTLPALIFGTSDQVYHQYYYDAVIAHLPQVNYFVSHPFDLKSYPATAAMTPGHHLFLAWGAALFGYETIDAQNWVVISLNTAAAFAFVTMTWVAVRGVAANAWVASLLTLPIVGSIYVVSSAIWVSTDNGALFFYALTLFIALFHREKAWLTGASSTLLIFWRHLYLPVAAVFAASPLFERRPPKRAEIIATLAAAIPSALVVFYFWSNWGGLTPPILQNTNKNTFSPGVPLQSFALLSLLSVPFGLSYLRVLHTTDRKILFSVAGVLSAVILSIWLIGDSDYNRAAGRWGSVVWVFAKHTPLVHGHSPIVLLLALAGAFCLATILAHGLTHRYVPAAAVMLVLYIVAYSAQIMAWQRYLEPQILLTLAVFAVQSGALKKWELVGPVAMGALFSALSTARVYGTLDQLFG